VELQSIIEYPVRPESQEWFDRLAKLAQPLDEILCVEVVTPESHCWEPEAESAHGSVA